MSGRPKSKKGASRKKSSSKSSLRPTHVVMDAGGFYDPREEGEDEEEDDEDQNNDNADHLNQQIHATQHQIEMLQSTLHAVAEQHHYHHPTGAAEHHPTHGYHSTMHATHHPTGAAEHHPTHGLRSTMHAVAEHQEYHHPTDAEEHHPTHGHLHVSASSLTKQQLDILDELWLHCSQGNDGSLIHIFHSLRDLPRSILDVGDDLRAGKNALIFSSEKNHVDCVKVLVEHGASVNVANAKGSTAALMATFNGHLPILQFLADAGADMEKANCDGYTPTLIAAREGRAACLQFLLEIGCDIHRKNKHGDTSVTLAAMVPS